MKKITFILFALIAGTTFAQSASANAAADIVSPLTIVKSGDLNFGKVSNATAGSVIIKTDGTEGTGSLSQVGSTSISAASFTVNAASGYSYAVTVPSTEVTLSTTDSKTIKVNTFVHDAGASKMGTGADQTVNVGATLDVAAGQSTGNYTGSFNVSVAYE